jgi:hypothetical protein
VVDYQHTLENALGKCSQVEARKGNKGCKVSQFTGPKLQNESGYKNKSVKETVS